jgi:hypothetical protein
MPDLEQLFKRLPSVETDLVSLEVMECTCGFHMGLDVTYMEQVGDFEFKCPACGLNWSSAVVFPEDLEDLGIKKK